jgi:hypothetical protein
VVMSTKNLLKISIFCLCFTIFIVLFWPGLMSADSLTQYASVLSGVYNNHHPVMMSIVWQQLIKIHEGSGLMFVLHTSMLWTGVWIFYKSLNEIKKYSSTIVPNCICL